ncbi:MAG: hypothetical protein ING66_09055 [Rhodocyclaceae bacterium]|nr:hypothetical protein [Rhodocyclaceae bacterium]MCA3060383.1 hypothetical protein [Rhodocyclaceae bacterium]MCA3084609.1 hypothetical protein [Rhodocyclaceae bacterium]
MKKFVCCMLLFAATALFGTGVSYGSQLNTEEVILPPSLAGYSVTMMSTSNGKKVGSLITPRGQVAEIQYGADGKIDGFVTGGKFFQIRVSAVQPNPASVQFEVNSVNGLVTTLKVPKQETDEGAFIEPTSVLSEFYVKRLPKTSPEEECQRDPSCYVMWWGELELTGPPAPGFGSFGGGGGVGNICDVNKEICLNGCGGDYDRQMIGCGILTAAGFILGRVGGAVGIAAGALCALDAVNTRQGCQDGCVVRRFSCGP